MRARIALSVLVMAVCSLALSAHAAPPEGKGPGHQAGHPGKGHNSGKGGLNMRGNHAPGHHAGRGEGPMRHSDSDRRYDDRGRHSDYFDGRRDRRGHVRGGDLLGDLVYAGITAALAREYALDFGLRGYSSLPPGIRKNLARGKPLPPGIAKKMVPGSLMVRLPRHPGYEWRIAGTDLILVSVVTAVIADILYDVFD